jgi:NAD(P)-dependent dehydrogenase (short-subunit alcohol dehydrogenase family)
LIAFTKSLETRADAEIRVNSVAPAAVATDILEQMDPTTFSTGAVFGLSGGRATY